MKNYSLEIEGKNLRNYSLNINKEYFIGNGRGSFSSACPNTNYARQYHGLFIRSYNSPINRYMALYKIEENLNGEDLSVYKTLNINGEKINRGDKFLQKFEQNPFPKFKYFINGSYLEKEIIMAHMRDLVGVKYSIGNPQDEFYANIFMNFRDVHVLNEVQDEEYILEKLEDCYCITLKNEKMYIYTNGEFIIPVERVIRENIMYELDIKERGEQSFDSSQEVLKIRFKGLESGYIIGSFEKLEEEETLDRIAEKEINRIKSLKEKVGNNKYIQDLSLAVDCFITHKESTGKKTIVAGYPWFNDWGRDTMIAFTGATLATGRFQDAKSVLKTFAEYCSQGMLPNNFPDSEKDSPMYNTIDGSLWYFHGIYKYLEYTNDYKFIEENIYKTMEEIIRKHIEGTRYNIKVDIDDGLLSGGSQETQLTWMDVKYKGYAVTPRWGKAVEINALWYNALCVLKKVSKELKKEFLYEEYLEKFKKNYKNKFLNKEGYLNDYICEIGINKQMRPNQIIATSLPFTVFTKIEIKKIVDIVYKKLYTPYGLRSLNKEDKEYIGIYSGDLYSRDMAYHQGTVWAWLMGPFIDSYKKAYEGRDLSFLLEGLKNHFYNDACLGNISEIFDGDEPHLSRGCYAQAWSVAELLRINTEILK